MVPFRLHLAKNPCRLFSFQKKNFIEVTLVNKDISFVSVTVATISRTRKNQVVILLCLISGLKR